jgi:hypothetical protein
MKKRDTYLTESYEHQVTNLQRVEAWNFESKILYILRETYKKKGRSERERERERERESHNWSLKV